jgi:hypothetical protein
MVTVPPVVPEVPYLKSNPVIAYLSDDFQNPYRFIPTVIVDVTSVFEQIVDMLAAHDSQLFEWLPYNQGILDQIPKGVGERRAWLAEDCRMRLKKVADQFRSRLIETYGADRGSKVEMAEAFEGCEYGSPLTAENAKILFPFK